MLNNLVIQDGVGIDNLGGGIWNGGQLTLNHSTVTHNTAYAIGGIFNMGRLTLNNSTVSHNTATTGGGGGIFNCGANPSFQAYGLCTGPPGNLTLNGSLVSDNVSGSGNGGVSPNDPQAVMTLNGSIVSGNSTGGNGGGIENDGTVTLNISTVSGNSGGRRRRDHGYRYGDAQPVGDLEQLLNHRVWISSATVEGLSLSKHGPRPRSTTPSCKPTVRYFVGGGIFC